MLWTRQGRTIISVDTSGELLSPGHVLARQGRAVISRTRLGHVRNTSRQTLVFAVSTQRLEVISAVCLLICYAFCYLNGGTEPYPRTPEYWTSLVVSWSVDRTGNLSDWPDSLTETGLFRVLLLSTRVSVIDGTRGGASVDTCICSRWGTWRSFSSFLFLTRGVWLKVLWLLSLKCYCQDWSSL